ncbi:MAG: dipeptide ABC transporter ATP-binding protein [Halanaerobiaceae bacterium]|nr:dipeptide ABC transporter ATP-binding protein [Halanaerobiaceae bacterium]
MLEVQAEERRLLEVKNLKKYFPVKAGVLRKTVAHVKAVDGVSFHINEGETLGLVGESGCGKSTTGHTILRLLEATGGEVIFDGKDVLSLNRREMREIRKEMQIIFQDPYASLNPRMTVGEIIAEPLIIHKLVKNKEERREKVAWLLDSVGLTADHMSRFPHEFSGGQRQRIGIARALAVNPRLIIADEPVSALDVSIQAQVINLLQDLQKKFSLTYLFIAHDLSVVKHISDRIGVMYLGKIVELADKDELFNNPLHPYTKALLSAIPVPDPEHKKERIILKGDVPNPVNPPKGCPFHPRCPSAKDICKQVVPELKDYGNGHFASCHLLEE